MKRILLISLVVVTSVVLAAPLAAFGADYGGKIRKANYVVARAGVFFPSSDLHDLGLKSGFAGEVAVGRHINDNIAVEVGVGYFKSDGDNLGVESDVSVIPITGTAILTMPVGFGEAYVGGGLGVYFARLEQKLGPVTTRDDDIVLGGHLMGGANFDVSQDMYVGIEGKWIITDEASFFGRPVELGGAVLSGKFGVRF